MRDPTAQSTRLRILVARLESALAEPDTQQRKNRIKNLHAELKYWQVSLPAMRAFLAVRKRLRLAQTAMEKLSPDRRIEVAELATLIGDTSELFQFPPNIVDVSALDRLRG